MNFIVLKGRIVATPELKTTNSGVHVTHFAVAVDRNFGENKKVDFIDCVAWRKTADFITKYFPKGKPILINGTLITETWEDRDGKKRKSYEVLVDNAEFAGGDKVSDTGTNSNTPDVFADTGSPLVDLSEDDDEELPWK